MNIKRWLFCGFLFLICFLFLRWLNNKNVIEDYAGYGGGGGRGGGGSARSRQEVNRYGGTFGGRNFGGNNFGGNNFRDGIFGGYYVNKNFGGYYVDKNFGGYYVDKNFDYNSYYYDQDNKVPLYIFNGIQEPYWYKYIRFFS
jgi:hypothetical protein